MTLQIIKCQPKPTIKIWKLTSKGNITEIHIPVENVQSRIYTAFSMRIEKASAANAET